MLSIIQRSASTSCLIVGLVAGLTCDSQDVRADSLWKKRDPQRAYLFYDSRARNVGDLLTLIISEASEVDNSENRSLNKDSSNSVSGDYAGSSSGGFAAQAASASLDIASSAKRAFSGKANYQDSREYTDQITVTVVDVLPNGNLVISGRRCLSIAGEQRTLVVSGVVRPIDLGPDNKISSRYVADLKTVYEGEGTSKRFVRQGWLSRAANRVWPF
ncbi:MAG: flagellar basal body L-ring protein FlgH [Planctomycetaceae bacterium]